MSSLVSPRMPVVCPTDTSCVNITLCTNAPSAPANSTRSSNRLSVPSVFIRDPYKEHGTDMTAGALLTAAAAAAGGGLGAAGGAAAVAAGCAAAAVGCGLFAAVLAPLVLELALAVLAVPLAAAAAAAAAGAAC